MDIDERQTIERAMGFPMEAILERYRRDLRVPPRVAREHERELKRFLALCALRPGTTYGMSRPVDDLWHTFLLFTREYALFCQTLGRFIHHVPTGRDERVPEEAAAATHARFLRDYEAVFDESPPAHLWPPVGRE